MSNVDSPAHYNVGKIEVIDFIDDQKLDFTLGNAVKYICRAKHKGTELEDLKKARWYLDHAIQKLESSLITVVDAHFEDEPVEHYVGPFVGKRVESPLEEKTGVILVDDGEVVKVQWADETEPVSYPLAMFKSGLKEKWLVWVEESKKD